MTPEQLHDLDRQHVWHPFTQMRDWMQQQNTLIVEGEGTVLRDSHGKTYLDANSSIWTNLHGHRHPALNAAIRAQLDKVAHTSALGLANEPASILAGKLAQAANPPLPALASQPALEKVFYSDDGSTAIEVALKLAFEFTRRTRGTASPKFLSLDGAYHGDTVGAVSLGHIDMFHAAYDRLLFSTEKVMAPYCYRCPFNQAKPERADARCYRQCHWECVGKVEQAFGQRARTGDEYAAFAFEPRMQGAAGMIPQPDGWLKRVAEIARGHGALLIADEVMTGFGRTGASSGSLFASHKEEVQPDFLAVAKGLTGGYLPMAATLTHETVFAAFLGDYADFKTFFHGHSYTANQLGAAVGIASLELLETPESLAHRQRLEVLLAELLQTLWPLPHVGDIRQEGLVAGIELVRDWRTREPYGVKERAGFRVCDAMAADGVLTRPVGSVLVLMPPYCTTPEQLEQMVATMARCIRSVLD
jgi:adenosylmethionine-8-amino-7-oxononanoate aminotransferase